MRRRLSLFLAAAFAGLSYAPPTAADSFESTRSEDLVPFSHRIDVVIHRGYADIVTERTVFNGGERHDQALFMLDLPPEAVATRLRTRGMLNGQPHWFEGELLEAELAARRYQELTGIGGYYPKDPALLSWRDPSRLALQVFPCPPGEFKKVAYTLRVPTDYRDGRERVVLPVLGDEHAVPRITVTPGVDGDQVFADDRALTAGTPWLLEEEVELSLAHRRAHRLEGALASIPAGPTSVTHLRIDAAARISTVPAGANVVVLIDRSRSYGAMRTAASVGAARSYLASFQGTGARVRVALFDREVHPLDKGFAAVGDAIGTLEGVSVQTFNGSHLDRAFAFAEKAFAGTPVGAPRRLLVLTDTMTRASLRPEVVRAVAQRAGAVVHLADVQSGEPGVARDDQHTWAMVPRATGGLFWSAAAAEDTTDEQRAVFEEWARPLRIDRVAVDFHGANVQAFFPETLDEGQSFEMLELTPSTVSSVALTGELWSTPVRQAFSRDPEHERRWAGLVFGSELFYQLDEAQQEELAWQGRVVSPVTSFLAIEPGVRPSTEGLDWSQGLGSGSGSGGVGVGLGGLGTIGHGAGDHAAWLERNVGPLASRCGVAGRTALTLESTVDEIVEVRAVVESGTEEETRCITEAVWGLRLDTDEFFEAWAEHAVRV